MIQITISPEQFRELYGKGYTLDMIYILKMFEAKVCTTSHPKIDALEETLKRKGLLDEKENITEKGNELLSFLTSEKKVLKTKKVKSDSDDPFLKWWSTYPSTDTFEYKNKKFKGTRALKTKKDECKAKIIKLLASGEFTIDELVEALKLEIYQKAENSIKTGINKMSYFQNSLTYLNQGTYEPFVDLVRKGHKVEEDKNQSVTSNETFI